MGRAVRGTGAAGKVAALRQRRMSYGVFPEPQTGAVPYANSRPELAGFCLGEKVGLLMQTAAWAEVMKPRLAKLEADRPAKGPAPSYSSTELESCLLYQRLTGAATYGEARALLAGDRGAPDREALGFDRPRKRVGAGLRLVRSLDGVPSETTVWRHLQRFGLDAHVAAYRELFERITKEHFEEFPELADEARLVGIDGSALLSHYSSFERTDPATGETLPPTLEGGGYMPRTEDNTGKDGHGFNLVAAVTQSGLPLTARLTPIAEPEAKTARAMLEDEWKRVIAPYLHDDHVRIMACDAAYSGSKMRAAIHRAGFIPNCHPVSHGPLERSVAHAGRRDQAKLAIRNRPNWHLNGHMELTCKCGHGKTLRRATRKPGGEAVARLVGECVSCGSVTLTAGEWRLYQSDKPAVAKVLHDEQDRADWRIGNPLTFNDPLSAKYVSTRFSQQEGFHGTLVTRFGQLKEKQWYRRREEAERDLLQVFCLMHALAMTQRRRAKGPAKQANAPADSGGAGRGGPPPPLARAA